MTSLPFEYSSGPRTAQIAIVGDVWGLEEARTGKPFMGTSGQELTRLLREAGIARHDCFLTNVFALQPVANNIEYLCGKKSAVGENYTFPAVKTGNYILPEYLPEVFRLKSELEEVRPNITIALGNIACWALLQSSGIMTLRGVVNTCTLVPGLKVLPTYHPSTLFKDWAKRVIVLADLMKAKKEMQFPEIIRPEREFLINPTLDEISNWIKTHGESATSLAIDIETHLGQIDMIGFSAGVKNAMVIPFFCKQTLENFWQTLEEEVRARQFVQHLLALPCPKIFQNGLYDMQYLAREEFYVRNPREDTMLLQHALFPEMPKGLGFLGSIHTNEAAWKLLNKGKLLKKDA